jgi:aspartate carbamoyltransferase catalytic subunit
MGVRVCHTLEEGIQDADVVIMLRLQNERMSGALLPARSISRASASRPRSWLAKPDAIVMHRAPSTAGRDRLAVVDGGQA